VYTVSGKVLTPFFAMALILSMAVNLVPQQTLGLQGSGVHGILEDLFGSSDDGTTDTISSTDSTAGGTMFIQITGIKRLDR